jgi:hypothetical protein
MQTIDAAQVTQEDIEELSPFARDLVRIAGLDAAVMLFNTLGGQLIGIPKGRNNNAKGKLAYERLESVIGADATVRLCKEFGGERIEIPRCHALRNELRARAIRRDYDAGVAVNDLVAQHAVSHRAIEKILKRAA